MQAMNATEVRKEWSAVCDSVIREKPKFIKRTRDYMFLSDINTLNDLLSAYQFTAEYFVEEDDSAFIYCLYTAVCFLREKNSRQ